MANDKLAGGVLRSLGLAADAGTTRIKVVVLAAGARLCRAESQLVRLLQASEFAELSAVAYETVDPASCIGSGLSAALRTFMWLDRLRCGDDDPLSPATEAAPPALPAIRATDQRKPLDAIRELAPDVLISLAPVRDVRALAAVARLGVWVCCHGAPAGRWPDTVGVTELFGKHNEFPVRLQQYAPNETGDCRRGSLVLRIERGHSLIQTRVRAVAEGNQLILLALHACSNDRQLPTDTPAPVAAQSPGNLAMLGWLAAPVARRARRFMNGTSASPPEWKVALRKLDPLCPERVLTDRSSFRVLDSPPGLAWADPHLVVDGGRTWLFVEELEIARSGSGRIVCMEIRDDGSVSDAIPCLRQAGHLSFPQVFSWLGEWFMVPESSSAGCVQLLRARRFPDDWVVEKVLFDGPAVDTVVWPDQATGAFRFITSVGAFAGQFPVTMLFQSASLTGQWTLHPASPIGLTSRLERNAGALFHCGGRLVRPVQDGMARYGHSMQWQLIELCDASRYVETAIGRIEPDWTAGILATHSYTCTDRWEALDALVLAGRSQA